MSRYWTEAKATMADQLIYGFVVTFKGASVEQAKALYNAGLLRIVRGRNGKLALDLLEGMTLAEATASLEGLRRLGSDNALADEFAEGDLLSRALFNDDFNNALRGGSFQIKIGLGLGAGSGGVVTIKSGSWKSGTR